MRKDGHVWSSALLAPWPRDQRFGVEIDSDQVKAGGYHAITGDVRRVFPMLRKLGVRFPQILANPPFGLDWTDGTGRAENSTVAVWRMSLALLAPEGVGAFIWGVTASAARCSRARTRLGYLTDLDSILCTRSDLERGFKEGERYPLRTDSRINVIHGEKVTRNKQGEPIAEAELRAAWETTAQVIPFVPRPQPPAPIQPLRETEQLELFAA